MLASGVVKRQLTWHSAALRCFSHAATSRRRRLGSGIRRFKHWRARTLSSVSAIANQRPGLGVSCISTRASSRRASAGGNASYQDAGGWVFRWSMTSTIFSACGYCASTTSRISWATSAAVRRSVTFTRRCPANGSKTLNRWAVPWRSYSSSTRSGCPGAAGMGRRGSATSCVLVSSRQTWGRWGS
jgi:hypothetical protein